MNRGRMLILAACLFSLFFISACRTTEGELQGISPTLAGQVRQVDQATRPMAARGPKIPWVLLAAAVLVGAFMVFTADRGEQKKPASKSRTPSKRRRKK